MTDPAPPAAPPEAQAALPTACPNCGEAASGRFCAVCGQRQGRRLASIRTMAAEAIQDQFSLGSELPRTVAVLLFRPGRLTKDYLAGRIARYVPPLRLYLVASLMFFFIGSLDDDDGLSLEIRPPAPDTTAGETVADRSPVQIKITVDSGVPRPLRPTMLFLQRRAERISAMKADEFNTRFVSRLRENIPTAVFVLLPIAALLLKLLYARSKRLYAEHFIFALHVHAFVFLIAALTGILTDGFGTAVVVAWVAIYVFLSMLRVYGQSRSKTLLKFLILSTSYSVALLGVLLGTAVVTALTV